MSTPEFYGISAHVTIVIAPENIDKFLAASKPVFDAVTAEPDCTYFELFHDADQPGTFRIVENWSRSKEWWLNCQVTKDYYRPYEEATKPMWLKPREVQFFEQLGPRWTFVKAANCSE